MSLNYTDLVDAIRAAIGERPELLTKREWFAGLAMQAVLQLPLEGGGECDELMMDLPSKAAEVCVACADALLAELAKEPTP